MEELAINRIANLYPPFQIRGEEVQRPGANFADLLKGFVNDVNRLQIEADNSIKGLATGRITDVHQVMVAVEEANLALQLILEVRNKLLEGYQELMRMTV